MAKKILTSIIIIICVITIVLFIFGFKSDLLQFGKSSYLRDPRQYIKSLSVSVENVHSEIVKGMRLIRIEYENDDEHFNFTIYDKKSAFVSLNVNKGKLIVCTKLSEEQITYLYQKIVSIKNNLEPIKKHIDNHLDYQKYALTIFEPNSSEKYPFVQEFINIEPDENFFSITTDILDIIKANNWNKL